MSIELTQKRYQTRGATQPLSQAASSQYSQMQQSHKSPRTPRTPKTPRTPQNNSYSYTKDSNKLEYGSIPKSRCKSQSKNFMTSPAMNRKFQNITPQNGYQSSTSSLNSTDTPTVTAYAGPTFHSSPAPSTLPIPSFYSKPIPYSPSHNTPKFINDVQAIESELKLLLKINTEEKKTPQIISLSPRFSPESTYRHIISPHYSGHSSDNAKCNDVREKTQSQTRPLASTMLSMELGVDSDSNTSCEAPFSTTFSQRINAIRPIEISRNKSSQQTSKKYSNTANAEALKAYLFSGHLNTTVSSTSSSTSYCN